MIQLVNDHLEELTQICRQYNVKRLELFGSAADETFDPKRSDLDFLVEFLDLAPGQHADTYYGMLEGIQNLFQCKVDLVMIKAVKNPYSIQAIEQTRTVLYAA